MQNLEKQYRKPKKWMRGEEAEYMKIIANMIMSREQQYPYLKGSFVPYLLLCRTSVFFSQLMFELKTSLKMSPILNRHAKTVNAISLMMQPQQKNPSGRLQIIPKSYSHPQPVLSTSIRLSVSRTRVPMSTLIIKKMVSTFISFICNSYWKWMFSHWEDLEMNHRRVELMMLRTIGRNILGTLMRSWLLESTMISTPTMISTTDRLLNRMYLMSFTFQEAPILIQIMSAGYCAQFTMILLLLSLKCVSTSLLSYSPLEKISKTLREASNQSTSVCAVTIFQKTMRKLLMKCSLRSVGEQARLIFSCILVYIYSELTDLKKRQRGGKFYRPISLTILQILYSYSTSILRELFSISMQARMVSSTLSCSTNFVLSDSLFICSVYPRKWIRTVLVLRLLTRRSRSSPRSNLCLRRMRRQVLVYLRVQRTAMLTQRVQKVLKSWLPELSMQAMLKLAVALKQNWQGIQMQKSVMVRMAIRWVNLRRKKRQVQAQNPHCSIMQLPFRLLMFFKMRQRLFTTRIIVESGPMVTFSPRLRSQILSLFREYQKNVHNARERAINPRSRKMLPINSPMLMIFSRMARVALEVVKDWLVADILNLQSH